jgi:acyl-CoA synthetase (AMP-forming)/AMP-acid ligase II
MSKFTAAHHTAVAQLTGSGAPFEVTDTPRGNYFVKTYRNAEPNLRSVMTPGRQFGDALFLEYLDQKWTFNQFFKAVDALAGHLQTVCGVQPGDRVAIAMRNRPEWLVAFVAIVECAGVAVPLNSWGKTQELQQGLEDSAAGVVVCDSPRFNFIRAADIDVTTLLVDAEPADEPDYHWHTALQAQLSATPVEAEPSDPAILLFTSGTAGKPKGAVFTHTNACQALMNIELIGAATYMTNTDAMNRQMGSGTPAKTLLAVPLFHISGLFSQFIINLRHGRGLYLMYKWDAREALRLVRESGITVLMGAPTMLLDLLGREDATPADFSAIANVSAGGADTPPLLHDLYRRQIHESLAGAGWGLTESGGTGAAFTGLYAHERPGASGFPSPIMEFRFCDEHGEPVPAGEPGEMWVRSGATIPGYVSGATDNAEFENGWMATGDIGYIDDEGLLYVCGRAKDMVLRGGENIYPSEIEAILLEHPACEEVAVIALPDATWGEIPAAVVRIGAEGALSKSEWHDWCKARMAAYKVPSQWQFTSDPLPRNAVNKLLKPAIREQFFS